MPPHYNCLCVQCSRTGPLEKVHRSLIKTLWQLFQWICMFWEHWKMASSYLIKVKEEPDQLNSQTNMEWFIETSIQYKRYILPLESTLLFISIYKGAPRKRSNSNPDCFVKGFCWIARLLLFKEKWIDIKWTHQSAQIERESEHIKSN